MPMMSTRRICEGSEPKIKGRAGEFADHKEIAKNHKTSPECLTSLDDSLSRGRSEPKYTIPRIDKKEEELRAKSLELQKAHNALEVLLTKMEKDKEELEENMLMNIRNLVEPYLEKLEMSELDDTQKYYLNILQSTLNEVVSPFSKNLSSKYLNFTPSEIRVAYHVKQGKSTKEIADLLRISCKTVGFHRENIRDKLGVKKKKANLRTQLLSFM